MNNVVLFHQKVSERLWNQAVDQAESDLEFVREDYFQRYGYDGIRMWQQEVYRLAEHIFDLLMGQKFGHY